MNTHKKFNILAIALNLFFVFLVFHDEIFKINQISTSNPGDQRFNFLIMQWGLDWVFGNLPNNTTGLFNLGIFYPYQNSLALSSNHLGSLPINFMLNFFSDDWFTRGNLWLYFCYFLNGLAAAYCARMTFIYLAKNYKTYEIPPTTITWSSLAISVAFAFSMTRIHFIDHSQTLPTFAMPFFFLYGWLALQSGSKTHALVAALFFSWQFYLDLHVALMAILLTVILIPIHFLILFKKLNIKIIWQKSMPVFVIFSVLCLVICTPLMLKYQETIDLFGDRGSGIKGPEFSNYFAPSYKFNKLYIDIFEKYTLNEDCVLPSILFFPLLLLVVGYFCKKLFLFLYNKGKNRSLWGLLEAGAFCLPIFLWMRFITHQSIDAKFMQMLIPGMNSIRTPGGFRY